jgi:hypothetical protein
VQNCLGEQFWIVGGLIDLIVGTTYYHTDVHRYINIYEIKYLVVVPYGVLRVQYRV